jgi:hypothetical protein
MGAQMNRLLQPLAGRPLRLIRPTLTRARSAFIASVRARSTRR